MSSNGCPTFQRWQFLCSCLICVLFLSLPSAAILAGTGSGSDPGSTTDPSPSDDETTVLAVGTNLDQLHNGTASSAPAWANGNINGSNSCYSEGNSVAFRYFVTGADPDTAHFFTIQMEWTKAGIHAYDYLSCYDASEDSAITLAGGPCGSVGTSPPGDCDASLVAYAIPDPRDTSNWTGLTSDDLDSFAVFFDPGFSLEDCDSIKTYGATITGFGPYYFSGSTSDRELNIKVYFTIDNPAADKDSSVGFYWGGHLAEGSPAAWGFGNGSASVAGAPYHMRALDFDDGGGANQDRSIQNGVVCLPPAIGLVCDADTVCNFSTYTYVCRDTSDANSWDWSIVNGVIVGSSTDDSVVFHVGPGASVGDTILLILTACDTTGGCPGDFCCATDTSYHVVVDCNNPPEVTCHADTGIFLCDTGEVCLDGFSCFDPDGNLASCVTSLGTLSGDTICFTATGEGVYEIILTATDSLGLTAVCTTYVTISLNDPPVADAGADQTLFLCDPQQICWAAGCSDPDANLDSCYLVSGAGTFDGSQICFTPGGSGTYEFVLKAVDACGEVDYDTVTVDVTLNTPPVASCPAGGDTLFLCSLTTDICLTGFSCSDVDGNLVTCTVSPGTLSGDTVCFTPVAGWNTITLIAIDSCGAADTCETSVYVIENSPPVCDGFPNDTTVYQCASEEICLPVGASDVDGNFSHCTVVSGDGSVVNGEWCFTPTASGQYSALIRCLDSCGAYCEDTVTVTVGQNVPPQLTCPDVIDTFLCEPDTICYAVTIVDPDDGLVGVVSPAQGWFNAVDSTICFYADTAGTYVFTLVVTDNCGAADTCTTTVNVTLNSPPIPSCPLPDTVFLCDLDTICIDGFSCDDPDNNFAYSLINGSPFGGGQYCFVPTAGMNWLVLECVDSCDASAACTTSVFVELNSPPNATCPSPDTVSVCQLDTICLDGFSCDDPDNNYSHSTINGDPFAGGQYCFLPTVGLNYLVLGCVDSCDAVDACTTFVYVEVNSPPVATCPSPDTVFVCELDTLCVDGFSCDDPDNNFAYSLINGSPFSGGQYCFVPTAGMNYLVLECVDSCDAADACTTFVYVGLNRPPSATCPSPDTVFVCELDTICVDGFSCDDPDNNYSHSTINGDPFAGGQYCFLPTAGLNYLVLECVDSCDAVDACTTFVYVVLNRPPDPICPSPDTLFLCQLDTICVDGFSCDDPDNNFDYSLINGSPFSGGQYCFMPTAGMNWLVLECIDSCDALGACTTFVYVEVNQPPQCADGYRDTTINICRVLPDSICLPPFGVTDPDNNLSQCTVNGQPYIPGASYCFTPVLGPNEFILTCADSCGEQVQCTTIVTVEDTCVCPSIVIEKTHMSLQGQHEYVDVVVDSGVLGAGAFDILIVYDRSALNFQSILPGDLFDLCDWEYITYRTWFWPSYEPHFFWGGVIRVVALADLNDGANHPDCYWLEAPFTLFTIDFLVTDNRLFECQFAPVSFFWTDCGDNTFSDISGDTLFVSDQVFGYDLVGEITDPTTGFPTYTGVQEECFVGGGPGKPVPIPCFDFYSGGVDIACADSLDDRADINLNGLAYEIADAVVFTNYFIYGLSAFVVNVNGQIAATDVNADGLTLTVGDLVFLIRVIVGDALPYPRLTPVTATYMVTDGVISVDGHMGAALAVIDGDVRPTLLVDNMELRYAYDADQNVTRALVYSLEGHGFSGAFLDAGGEIVGLEFGSYEGAVVRATEMPIEFSLTQNYPNPFNPTTTISFTLPTASEYQLTVYNVTGQAVKEFTGYGEAGAGSIEFDASDLASGVYFYRFAAGNFTATRKMMLIK